MRRTVRGGRPRSGRRTWSARSERGSTTVVGAIAVAVVLTVLMGGVQLGAAVITRHRAEAAADLAALAAAANVVGSAEAACGAAERVTDRMAVLLTRCELRGWTVTVRVEASRPA